MWLRICISKAKQVITKGTWNLKWSKIRSGRSWDIKETEYHLSGVPCSYRLNLGWKMRWRPEVKCWAIQSNRIDISRVKPNRGMAWYQDSGKPRFNFFLTFIFAPLNRNKQGDAMSSESLDVCLKKRFPGKGTQVRNNFLFKDFYTNLSIFSIRLKCLFYSEWTILNKFISSWVSYLVIISGITFCWRNIKCQRISKRNEFLQLFQR